MKRNLLSILLVTAVLLSLFSETENGQKKVALIIGNSSYDEPLANALTNTESMTTLMEGLGFTVYSHTNLDQRSFIAALQDFNKEIKDAEAALLYFTGYTYQTVIDGYLLPVNSKPVSEENLTYKGVSLSDVFLRMSRSDCPNIFVFMDTVSYRGFLDKIDETNEIRIPPEAKDMSGVYSLGTIDKFYFTNKENPVTPLTVALAELLKKEDTDIRILNGDIAKRALEGSKGDLVLQTSTTLFDAYYLVKTDDFITQEELKAEMQQKEAERLVVLSQRLAEKAELEKQYAVASKRMPVFWTLAGLDVLAGASSVITGILGRKAYKQYYEVTSPEEALALKMQSQTYSYIFTSSLVTAGILSAAVLTLAFIPPQKIVVEKQLASIEGEIIRLGGSIDSDAAGEEEYAGGLSEQENDQGEVEK